MSNERLIDANELNERMYHDAIETDSDMQRWDGGCWIRYKMFENALNDAPTIDAVEVVRCGECKYADEYSHCSYVEFYTNPDDYCSRGERK